ncbi:hypothetical protein CPAR01_16239 [Colletotrichum paranaense]|uniref:Fungal N-terminal domain-containing protein n=1 Tax=Colletotrichum paranaense TaxID=1914294 RepID=A0ABQ9RW76_9PEZI|nr:uncharacterized protein CPAR01_16239 [Colletotrichum paranaense]KAK1516623.1 hypothetical protein CPAR01_16239 [Colletotrichum paranaense]
MAEVLGLVSSFAAIIQLVQYGEKFAKALYQYSEQRGYRAEKIEHYANDVVTFSDVVRTAHFSLSQHCKKYPGSPVLDFIATQGVLNNIAFQSGSVEQRLKKATSQIRSCLGSKSFVLSFFNWLYQKDSIKDLFPEMESIKTSLQLLLATAHFEIVTMERNDPRPGSSMTDMKGLEITTYAYRTAKRLSGRRFIQVLIERWTRYRLKEMIQMLMRALVNVHAERREIDRHKPASTAKGSKLSIGQPHDSLLQLGQSIVETGKVPEPNPASAASSSYSIDRTEVMTLTLRQMPIDKADNFADSRTVTQRINDFVTFSSSEYNTCLG